MEPARRTGRPLTVALIDIDHFKRFNDTNGHQAGDQLLKSAAAAWSEALRAGDVIYRYGGEEFALLLADSIADEDAGRNRTVTAAGCTGADLSRLR